MGRLVENHCCWIVFGQFPAVNVYGLDEGRISACFRRETDQWLVVNKVLAVNKVVQVILLHFYQLSV